MPAKKPKKTASKKRTFFDIFYMVFFSLIAITIVIVAAAVIARHFWEKDQLKKENIVFSQMENFVNKAKTHLEQEIPEGNWKIEKYCEKPSSKGDIDGYRYICHYRVESNNDLGDREKLISRAYKIMNNQESYSSTDPTTVIIDAVQKDLLGSCSFISWEENKTRHASVSCLYTTLVLRYPLRD